MKKSFNIVLFTLLSLNILHATHNRAGEITLIQESEFTYRIEIATFTYTLSAADRDELEVQWGDNSTSVAKRYYKATLPNFYYHNLYTARHTFPGPGTYTIVVQDPNRNYGVLNIPNSVNVIFSLKTTITINPAIGSNSTPILLNFPIDKAAKGQIFIHNPAAYDPDGDSISYELTVCTEEDGQPIENYTLPRASDTLFINSITGDLTWNTPVDTGIYNIAIKINEWRNGIKIGSISRDMQVEVYNTTNNPPQNMPLRDFCVEAGTLIQYDIISQDPDSDHVVQTASGGPFIMEDNPAQFETLITGKGYSISRFTWQTTCDHVRHQPYTIIIKAEDKDPDVICPNCLYLVDIDNFSIKVIGSRPENPETFPSANSIRVRWSACQCDNIVGYQVYRREGSFVFTPDSCENGIPGSAGFVMIGETDGRTDTTFTDNNNGEGLFQGVEYCYRILAVYEDGTLSYSSEEVCDILTPGNPAILNVSVSDPSETGSMYIAWAKPKGLDTIPATGPYEYILYRSDDIWGNNMNEIYSFVTNDLNDTTHTDTPLNTVIFPYSYKLELYNDEPGNRFLIGRQEVVSSTFLEIVPGDNRNTIHIRKNVPWINTQYVIYRQNPVTYAFDSIGISLTDRYVDTGLSNGREYCYQVKSFGWRIIGRTTFTTINYSHINCGTPLDTVPPCPPELNVISLCDSLRNELSWTNPNNTCADDVIKYRIYYSPTIDQPPGLIDSTSSPTDTTYIHFPTETMAGCYVVTAVDSFNNESEFSTIVCVDNCINYELPNVFTPNEDNINDIFRPNNYTFVEKVDMKIYNRWGMLVFRTEDPDINWDGKHMNSNQLVSPGVYYYICDVYENRITGLEVRNIVGFVYVFTQKGAVPGEK